MTALLLHVLSMSLTASVVILAVILARIPLRRAPKKISYWLWLAVAFRLCCPVSWNSPFSLFSVVPVQTDMAVVLPAEEGEAILTEPVPEDRPSPASPVSTAPAEEVTEDPAALVPAEDMAAPVDPVKLSEPDPAVSEPTSEPAVRPAEPVSDPISNPVSHPDPVQTADLIPETPVISQPAEPDPVAAPADDPALTPIEGAESPSEEPAIAQTTPRALLPRILNAAAVVWLCGIGIMLVYAAMSYFSVRRAMATAIRIEDGVCESDRIRSPFLLGVVRPKIYLPCGVSGDMLRYVLAHERYHIRRGDSAVKLFAFLLLGVHWFNPLVWLAFALMTRDMEMSCDEYVLSTEPDIRKSYSYSLLSFASGRQFPSPSPLSFGEGDVKSRIKNVLGWHRPKRWVTVVAIVLAAAAAVFCMANPMEKKTAGSGSTSEAGSTEDSVDTSVRSLVVLPEGDWTTRTADVEELLFTAGGWMDPVIGPDGVPNAFWNGWYKENGLFCETSLRFLQGVEMPFRWLGSRGEVSYDYRGSYEILEDGTMRAVFSSFDLETLSVSGPSFMAVFSLRADAGHTYGTEYRETIGVTLVSTDCPDFEALVGVELGMTGAAWFRGDLDGDPADAIVKLTSTDKTDADFASLPVYEAKAEEFSMGECLTVLYPTFYDADGAYRIDSEADPAPDAVLVKVTDLGDLCFYAENVGRQNGGERDSFRLKAFRWRGEWTALARPMWFTPNWFHLYRAEQAAFFFVQAPSGQDADMTYVLLTEDGAFCFDSTEAEAGYLLDLRADAAGMIIYGRTNADFLNLQTVEDHLRFRGREEDPYTENGTLRYENGRFVFTPETRQTPSEWFEAQKKTYPTSYPEETFGTMSLREYVTDWLPKYLRDERLHEKGLFTPEEAESVTRYMVERMMTEDWLKEDFAFDAKQASGFCFMIGTMKANAGQIPVPESLTSLWNNEWEGIEREDAYRIAAQMFGLNPEDPSALASPSFVYDEAQDSYRVALFTGLSHGYYNMEDVSVVWDYASVTVRFRLVAYQPGPEDSGEHAGVYADERIDFGEYRMIFHKPDGLDTQGLPRILFAKRGEIEAADSPEPPLSDELKNFIIYPDFFDDEQRDLYARATVFLPAVWGPTASYVEDFAPRRDGEPFLNGYNYPSVTVYDPERGLDCRYYVCHGRYENWADLDAAGRSLFTEELWESITGPWKRCMEFGGKTLFLDADAGSSGYDPTLDRFELVEKTEEKITYWFITSYRERGTLAVESSERTLITLVKTDLGWRFASFRQGDWTPAGTDAPERVSCYSEDYAEFIVRDIVRHVMDDSWLDRKTAYSALDAVRFVNTMPLWGYPYRVAEPSEDGMTVRILDTFCAEAVQNLFGIDNFDYFAAAREVFGDDASLSTERSEDGWIVWPTDMGELTTKFDIAGILAVSDEASTRVYVHLVSATDYPWDEADYGTFLFTFTPDFEGPALHVERIAHTSTRAEVERKIASLEGLRIQATNDMNNASAKIVEYDQEIARLRAILDDDSVLIEEQITAMQRLGDVEELREQQNALAERCLNAVKQFATEISWYEAALAEMRAEGIGILPEETVRGLYADLIEARYADESYQPYAAELCDLDRDDVSELIVFRQPTEATYPLDIYCIEDGEVRAFLSPFDVKKSEGAPDDDVALASVPADYAQAGNMLGFFRTEDGTVVLGAGIGSEFYTSREYYQFASMGGALRMRELFSAEWAGEWHHDEAKRNRTFVNGEEIAGGRDAFDEAIAAWITEFKSVHGPVERIASPADRWNIYNPDSRPPVIQVASWLRGKEQSETDALHAKGLFSRQETALIAEQLVTQTLRPEWLTDGDFRSAAGIFKLFGVSGTRYGEDYPAVFLEMIHESAGGYAIYPYDLKRLAVEFAGVPEAEFHVDDYLDNVTGYDPVNAEVYIVPMEGPIPRYEPENLTVEVRENGTAARFALYKVEYSMGYPRELLEKTYLGDWEISFTAQGDGMLPRMRFGKAEVQKVSYSPVFTGLNGQTFSPFTVDLPSSWQELVTTNMRDGTYPMVSFYTGDGSSPENAWEYLFTWLVTTNEISWDGTELQSWLLGDDICTFADASGRYYSMQFALMSGNEKHWTTADGDAQSVIAEYGEVLASLRPNEGYRIIHAEPGSPVLWQWDNYVNAAAAFEPIVERARIDLPAALASYSGYTLIPAVSFSIPKSSLWADGVQILSSMKTDESGAMVLDFRFADSGYLFFSIRTEIIPWQEVAGPIRLLPYEQHLRTCEVNVNGTIHWCRVTASFFDDEERRLITAPGGRSRPFTRLPDEVQIRLMLEAEAVLASVGPAESSPFANRGAIPGNLVHFGHIAQDTQGRIYFEDPDDRNLWRVNADGSDPVLLSTDRALYINVLNGWVTYVDDWRTIRRVSADGGDPVTLWEAPTDSLIAPHISCLFVTPDAIWFGARIDGIDRVYRMNTDGSGVEMILSGYTLEGVDGGKLFVSEHTGPESSGLYQTDIAALNGEFPVLEQIWEGSLYSAVVDEYGIAILVSALERIVVLDRETFAEIYSTRYTYVDFLWAYGKLSLYGYTGEHGDQWVIRQTDVSTGVTRDILTLGEEIFDNAGRTFGITFYDYYRSPEGEAVREAFAADHPELADQNGGVWPLTEQPMELQAVGGEVWCLARSVKALRETGLSDNWLICDGADGTVAQLGRSLSSDILASVPVVLPPVNAISSATSLDELPNLGLDGSDMRLAYIRAFVTGDIDALEQVCGVEKGMYADYRTLALSSWAVWFNAGEDGGPLRFAFVPTHSDVEAFPINVRTEGTLSVGLMGAYFSRPDSSSSFGEAAEALYELLSRHLLLDLPTTDDMDSPTRFDLSCYICLKLGNEDLTEENIAEYAQKHFGIENFTPDGGHVGIHGHGGSHQVLEIVGSEEIAGETAVTVQYYADLSKTLKSHTYRYTMKKIDDGWAFTGSEEIAHAEYEPVRWSM